LEIAHIKGWQCVVKKGDFALGEMVVYFEVESFLPEDERYELLHKLLNERIEASLSKGYTQKDYAKAALCQGDGRCVRGT
jgi:hypothetical protein